MKENDHDSRAIGGGPFIGSDLCGRALPASELLGGAATADITPPEPAALEGWTILRISEKVDTPLTANVLALESREGDRSLDAAVMISCDLVVISQELSQAVIEATRQRLPDFDLKKMFLNATHTHTGPTTSHGVYDIHVLRIGDAAVCTSRFELFNDFGVQIKARSKAVQTFVVQLAGEDGYLPTQRTVQGGGYSAIVQCNVVGPEGGQVLVDRTVELINSLWAKPEEERK